MKTYQAVLYDIDGTLLNTVNMNMYPLLRIIKEELGEERTLDDVVKFMAYTGMKVMEELGIRDPEATYQRWVRYVNEYEEGATPYPGMVDTLEGLKQLGVRQAVVSSKMRAQYQIDMVGNGLDKYMETAVLEEDTQLHKPHPAPLLECLRRMDLEPSQVLYVGDTPSDSRAAQAAGVDFAYATWNGVDYGSVDYAACVLTAPGQLLALFAPEN